MARSVAAVLSLSAIGVGCALHHPPLGLIVPGAIVFGLLVVTEAVLFLRKGK